MLFRLVRPVKRSSSSKSQFVRRIPRMCESEQRAGRCRYPSAQRSFTSPSRPEPKPSAFSLRTSDRSETKTRQAEAAAYLERPFISNKPGRSRTIWRPGAMRAQANYCRRPPSIRRLLPSGPSSFGWRGSQVTPRGSTSRMRTISALPTISLASKRPRSGRGLGRCHRGSRLEDAGGDALDRLPGAPMEVGRFLRLVLN
jgi:hypothetical protein